MPQRVLSFRVERDVVLLARQALALGFQREVVRNVLSHLLTPGVAELLQQERLTVELLAAVAVKAVAANEVGISAGVQVRVVGDDEAARPANGFTGGRAQARHETPAVFDGEMVHQVVAKDAFLIADALRKQRRAGIEQDACGLQGASGRITTRAEASRCRWDRR